MFQLFNFGCIVQYILHLMSFLMWSDMIANYVNDVFPPVTRIKNKNPCLVQTTEAFAWNSDQTKFE